MKVSRALRILKQTLEHSGDIDLAFVFDTGDQTEVGFFFPTQALVVGGDNEADTLAFMFSEMADSLLEEADTSMLPARITVLGPGSGEVH